MKQLWMQEDQKFPVWWKTRRVPKTVSLRWRCRAVTAYKEEFFFSRFVRGKCGRACRWYIQKDTGTQNRPCCGRALSRSSHAAAGRWAHVTGTSIISSQYRHIEPLRAVSERFCRMARCSRQRFVRRAGCIWPCAAPSRAFASLLPTGLGDAAPAGR